MELNSERDVLYPLDEGKTLLTLNVGGKWLSLGRLTERENSMTQTLLTYQIPKFEKTSMSFVTTKAPAHRDLQKLPEKLRVVIARLEGLDIGWLDILTAMANITEQWGEEQVVERLEATALSLKQNRRIIRDL